VEKLAPIQTLIEYALSPMPSRTLQDGDFGRIHRLDDQTLTGDGTTQSFTIGTATYPYRPKGLFELFVGGTTEDKRYQVVDEVRYTYLYNNNNSQQIAYEWYDTANDLWKIKINPIPSNLAVITYSYFYMPPVRTLTTDNIPAYNNNIIARAALASIYHAEDELSKEQQQEQEVEMLINDALSVENTPSIGQMQSMGAIENQDKQRGIGSY